MMDKVSLLYFMNFCLIIVLTGCFLNLIAIATNNGIMPVITTKSEIKAICETSNMHVCYDSCENVNKCLLTDILPYGFSIGDIIMILGLFSYSYLYVYLIRNRKHIN